MVELELLLLVGIAVGGSIVSTLILGLLTILLIHLKKRPEEEEEGNIMFPAFSRPGGQMFSMGDIQRAAAASAAAGEQEPPKKEGHKPEGSGGTYI